LSLIEEFPVNGYFVNYTNPPFLLPKIINGLIELIDDSKALEIKGNGVIDFNILKLDAFSWLAKCVTQKKYSQELDVDAIQDLLSTKFKTHYLEKIEQEIVKAKDFGSNDLVEKLPIWREKNEALKKINWIYPMYVMYKSEDLQQFLSPRFKFTKADHDYDEANRFNARKLRSHLFILLTVLNEITSNKIDYFFIYDELNSIKAIVEQRIISIIKSFAKTGLPSKIDILDVSFERNTHGSEDDELLPQIARAINWFDSRAEVINALTDTKDLLRILIILDWITSEGIKKSLIEKIKVAQLTDYLKNDTILKYV